MVASPRAGLPVDAGKGRRFWLMRPLGARCFLTKNLLRSTYVASCLGSCNAAVMFVVVPCRASEFCRQPYHGRQTPFARIGPVQALLGAIRQALQTAGAR